MENRKVLIIGAGTAGLTTARFLLDSGVSDVVVLEARDRVGGRIHSFRDPFGGTTDLGAAWIHGIKGNPVTKLAQESGAEVVLHDWDDRRTFENGKEIPTREIEALEKLYEKSQQILRSDQGQLRKQKRDISLSQGIENALAKLGLSGRQKEMVKFFWHLEIEGDFASKFEQLSCAYFDEDEEFGGKDYIFKNGYDVIFKTLGRGVDVRLEHVVSAVNFEHGKSLVHCRNGKVFSADVVVVTLPLGVLKKSPPIFDPPLSVEKTGAIERLGIGLLNKVVLRFPECYWDTTVQVFDIHGAAGEGGYEYSYIVNLARLTGEPTVVVYLSAGFAWHVSTWSDERIIGGALDAFRNAAGPGPEPVFTFVTRWEQDPFAFGSYSNVALGATPRDFDTLAAAEWHGSLRFAGEATNRKYCGCVHGAYLSGKREAKAILELIRK